VYFEAPLTIEPDDVVEWQWSRENRIGLQGRVLGEGRGSGDLKYNWYQSGGQLFARYTIPEDHHAFEVDWRDVSWDELIDLLR
jgi:hypothetical protein